MGEFARGAPQVATVGSFVPHGEIGLTVINSADDTPRCANLQ